MNDPQSSIQPQTAPTKLFRDEAKTGSVQCPACGGPITLKGFGAIERVACPYCGSESSPDDNAALELIQRANRQRRQSMLPLHKRGTLDGIEWEIIGISWRECESDGIVYPWQEFLLYNPYKGYRYLIFDMSNGQWSLGEALDGAPQVQAGFGHKQVEFKRSRYKHFQTVVASVTYVEGEFPWQVKVGDRAVAHEYIAPPSSVSVEESHSGNGSDVNFTGATYIPGDEVWKAFQVEGRPPPTSGIGTIQPNPWRSHRGVTWASFGVLMLLWLAMTLIYVGGRQDHVIYSATAQPTGTPLKAELEVPGSRASTLEVTLRAPALSNQYLYADLILVPQNSEEALNFGLQAEEWHGISGGESWREGDQSPKLVVGGVKPGKYTLEVNTEVGGASGKKDPNANERFGIAIKHDVVLARYIIIPVLIILIFPAIFWLLSGIFEMRRWANSDYVSTESD